MQTTVSGPVCACHMSKAAYSDDYIDNLEKILADQQVQIQQLRTDINKLMGGK